MSNKFIIVNNLKDLLEEGMYMTKLYFSAVEIALRLNEKLERIQYIIRRHSIKPTIICGGRKGYGQETLKAIRNKLKEVRKYSLKN